MSDLEWKADIIKSDGTSQSFTSDNYSELDFAEVKGSLDTLLLDKIALLERKLRLVTKQRDKALYYVDHDNIALDFEAEFKKQLEDLK